MGSRNNRVAVHNFTGATIEEIEEQYIQPTLKSKPDTIILHAGTNNLKTDDPHAVAEKLIKLCETVERESPDSMIAISELTHRTDSKDNVPLQDKVQKVNNPYALFVARETGKPFLTPQ